ncbi:LacI family DNA-binding transcriptional regulator [Nonomuraea sp. NPDC046570]|uniref:LacI family DNA-binding transcriptional regulator n=1 Tax=Nonomuraea sp. NPDC046570 TaxID=3155255 RepID=UPI00340BD578
MTRRLTQQDIARMAGVSQTTVSLVLNNRSDAEVRIAPETRERVLRVIRETGYAADPVARRLADRRNRILGVFTYEAVFPTVSADFYHPFLIGIEERAQEAGCDLLLFTSAGAAGGRRRIFSEDSRVRLADGCLLLGRTLDRDDLARLLAEGIPFVSVGRRDDAGAPVPYVGAAYADATRALTERAIALGHRRLAYVGAGEGAESTVDRIRGFTEATAHRLGTDLVVRPDEPSPATAGDALAMHLRAAGRTAEQVLDALAAAGVTVALAEDAADAVAIVHAARARGLDVPGELSIVALGAPTRPVHVDIDFTGFRMPRQEMGRRAVELLTELLENGGTPQELLDCELIDGSTLAPNNRR